MSSESPSPRPRSPFSRLAREGTLLSTGVVLALGLLLLVNYLGFRYHHRGDWTSTRLFSLSEQTENVLAALEKDVAVTSLLTPGSRLYEPTKELLARYSAASPRITVHWLDPQRNPVEAQRLSKQLDSADAAVVFEAGGDRRVITAESLAELDFQGVELGQEPEIAAFLGEERFTSALVALSQGRKPKIVLTAGHGELALDDLSASGLKAFQDLIGRDNVEFQEWSSLGATAVPEGADLVVVAGPKTAFVAPELALFSTYLAGGGRFLVLLDPTFGPRGVSGGITPIGLEAWLAGYGVVVGNDVVVDPSLAYPGFGGETFFAADYQAHPMTRSLAGSNAALLLRGARSLRVGSVAADYQATELLRTSTAAWGLTRFEGPPATGPEAGDPRGPLALALVIEPASHDHDSEEGAAPQEEEHDPDTGYRLVVVGDADFVTEPLLAAGPANAILAGNLVNALVARDTLLGIPVKKPEQVRLSMTGGEQRAAILIALVGLPGLAVAAGLGVWWRRRKTS